MTYFYKSHIISNIEKGVDILWVSKMLGHKDISITLKVYAKFIKEDDSTRINKLKKLGDLIG